MSDEGFALSLLCSLNIAVLVRSDSGEYTLFGTPPSFYHALFPPDESGSFCTAPWDYSVLLEFFLEDAEHFFLGTDAGALSSGIWQEESPEGKDLPLIATAMRIGEQNVLLIRNIDDVLPDHTRIVQKARENLLAQKYLHRSLDFYKKKSSRDALTSLYNREAFYDILSSEVEQYAFSSSPLTLLMVDIDDFKHINDEYGHLAGDKVLVTLGKIFMENLRQHDVAARYGGEEFILLAPNTALDQAAFLAEKIRSRVETTDFGGLPKITVSIGGTTFQPGDTPTSCIHRADMALYEAKRTGKNKVQLD